MPKFTQMLSSVPRYDGITLLLLYTLSFIMHNCTLSVVHLKNPMMLQMSVRLSRAFDHSA